MAGFYAWESVYLPIKVKNPAVLTDCDKIVVSLEQGNTHLDFFDQFELDLEEGIILLHLTQEDTSKFKPRKDVKLQVNFYYLDKERDTSTEAALEVYNNLYREVIT